MWDFVQRGATTSLANSNKSSFSSAKPSRNVDDLLEEQRTSLEVTFDARELVEAGRLVGAEGLVFVKAGCAAGRDVVDVKMTDTTLGTMCWSMHAENADASIMVQRLQAALQSP